MIDEIKAALARATPGEYETRCREFSNHASLEIWTNLGWLDRLPRDYREPTYELFAKAPEYLEHLIARVEKAEAEKLAEYKRGYQACLEEHREFWLKDEQAKRLTELEADLAQAVELMSECLDNGAHEPWCHNDEGKYANGCAPECVVPRLRAFLESRKEKE